MTRTIRVCAFVATGACAIAVVAALAVRWSDAPAFAALGPDGAADLAYVPAATTLVAFMDVRQARESPLGGALTKLRQFRAPNADAFEASTGVSFDADVDQVTAAAPAPPGGTTVEPAVLIARGRFDGVSIERRMRAKGAMVDDYRGTRVAVLPEGSHETALAFVEKGLLIYGDRASVRLALDTRQGSGAAMTANREFMALVEGVGTAAAWTVGTFDAVAARTGLPPAMARQLPPIDWLSLSGRLDGRVHGLIKAEAHDAGAATSLREVVRGFLTIARFQGLSSSGWSSVLGSAELGGEGRTVSLAFDVTAEALGQLASTP